METIKLIKCPKCGNYMYKVSENTGGYLFECRSCHINSEVSPDGYIKCSYKVFHQDNYNKYLNNPTPTTGDRYGTNI